MSSLKLKIMIIDDDENIRDWLSTILKNSDYDVVCLPDGENFHSNLTYGDIDLAIVDYHLPGKNGIQLVEEAVAAGHSTPIIILTSDNSQQVSVACFRAGAADFISKPIDADYLNIVVGRALATRGVNLKNAAFQALGYMRHKEDCRFMTHQEKCSCGLVEVISVISKFKGFGS